MKLTPAELAESAARSIKADLELIIRWALSGKDIEPALNDISRFLHAEIENKKSQVITSPYDGISDSEWFEAYDRAADRIFEEEGIEREPTQDEIEHSLECIEEEWRRA